MGTLFFTAEKERAVKRFKVIGWFLMCLILCFLAANDLYDAWTGYDWYNAIGLALTLAAAAAGVYFAMYALSRAREEEAAMTPTSSVRREGV